MRKRSKRGRHKPTKAPSSQNVPSKVPINLVKLHAIITDGRRLGAQDDTETLVRSSNQNATRDGTTSQVDALPIIIGTYTTVMPCASGFDDP